MRRKWIMLTASLLAIALINPVYAQGTDGNGTDEAGATARADDHGHDHDDDDEYGDHGAAPISHRKLTEMEHEKHLRRLAQIERLEQLGKENSNATLQAKARELRGNEQKRHERAVKRLEDTKNDNEEGAE